MQLVLNPITCTCKSITQKIEGLPNLFLTERRALQWQSYKRGPHVGCVFWSEDTSLSAVPKIFEILWSQPLDSPNGSPDELAWLARSGDPCFNELSSAAITFRSLMVHHHIDFLEQNSYTCTTSPLLFKIVYVKIKNDLIWISTLIIEWLRITGSYIEHNDALLRWFSHCFRKKMFCPHFQCRKKTTIMEHAM